MFMNLRKAAAVISELQKMITEYEKNLKPTAEFGEGHVSSQLIENELKEWQNNFASRFIIWESMQECFEYLRMEVGTKNQNSGVDDILVKLRVINSKMKFVEGLINSVKSGNVWEAETIYNRLERAKQKEAHYINADGGIKFNVIYINELQLKTLISKLANLKREKIALNDKLLEINIKTNIEVDEEMEQNLRNWSLI